MLYRTVRKRKERNCQKHVLKKGKKSNFVQFSISWKKMSDEENLQFSQ